MAVVPTGLPAWARTSDYATYGGDINKKNYAAQGAVNPTTDVTAEQFASLTADLAAAVRTVEFAVVTFTCQDTAVADPLLNAYLGMHGVGPAAAPAITRLGNGHVRVQWNPSFTDPYGVAQTLTLTGGEGSGHGSAFISAQIEITDARTIEVHIKDENDAYVLDKKVTVTVTTGGT